MLIDKEKAQQTLPVSVRRLGLFFGDVAEGLKAPDLKSADGSNPSVGSNPTVSVNLSPGGSANFHRGNLTTQPKAMRSDSRTIRLSVCGLNRRVHDGLPQLPTQSQAFR